jgi:hypothetical protein
MVGIFSPLEINARKIKKKLIGREIELARDPLK